MAYTLDELLDVTGINEFNGSHLKKTASDSSEVDFSKLAARCREAAEETPQEAEQVDQRGLVEKTAAVAIIQKTLSEIREIEGDSPEAIKTAAVRRTSSTQAAFIKSALEQGHSPEEIARFLEDKSQRGADPKKVKSSASIIA